MRVALHDAAPFYRDAPEASEARAAAEQAMLDFVREARPGLSADEQNLRSEILCATLGSLGNSFSEFPRSDEQIARTSNAVADMLCAYLEAGEEAGR